MPRADLGAARRTTWAGVGAVAATYVFFLLWAQFGFVALLRERFAAAGGGAAEVRSAMAAMGIAGLAASLGTAFVLGRVAARRLVRVGLLAAPLSALAALGCRGLPAFVGVSAATGVATALLTVSLAAGLRDLVPGRRLGLAVGLATGSAYLLCNVPAVFEASPRAQAMLVAAACTLAWAALGRPRDGGPAAAEPARPLFARHLYRRLGLAAVVAAFLALVWIDSAAFAAVQQSPALAAGTWGTAAGKWTLGIAHFVAAVAAGALLDAGLLLPVLAGTAATFGVALPSLAGASAPTMLWGVLYACGISAYSTALVVFPAGRGEGPGLVAGRWRAAELYGVAGWLGSALGVGMVQDLHRIPGAAVAAAVALVAVAVAGAWLARPGAPGRLADVLRTAVAAGGPAVLLAAGALGVLAVLGNAGPQAPAAPASAVARGRLVYRAEGCIHCHSQYVRWGTSDPRLWGPHRPLDRAQAPPLLGVRRQGPDLAEVGNRRSAVWQRLHLEDPRRLDPGSRMPSYAYLFAAEGGGGRSRGDDLVAYLDSLGAGTGPERAALVAAAPVAGAAEVRRASVAAGRRLFGRYCAVCHGDSGRGDGPLAATLRRPGMDLGKGALWSVTWGVDGIEDEASALARVVRFGIPGSPMPGHESLTRRQVAELVAYVETVVHPAAPPPGAAALDLGGGAAPRVVPCHFGTFVLALDRAETALPRFARAAAQAGVEWAMPALLGEETR